IEALQYALYIRGRGWGGNDLRAAPPPSRRPSLSLGRRPCRACGASTPTPGVSSPYVWTPWRRCYDCCADRLLGSSTRSSVRGTWSTTSSTLTRGFFRCAVRLVITIYDLLLASILGICGSDASVAYPVPYSGTRAILRSFWSGSFAYR